MSASDYNYNVTITFNDTDVDLRNDVRFFLYTRKNENEPQQLWIDDNEAIDKSLYDISKATKFMTHGHLNSYQGKNCMTVKKGEIKFVS